MTTSRSLRSAVLAAGLISFGSLFAQSTETAMVAHAAPDGHAMHDGHATEADAEITVVQLAQTPGAFTTEHLDLAAGQYQFEVTNVSVDHEVGFFIQRAADKDGAPGETAVENSFTTAPVAPGGTQRTGVVTLAPGEYVYSCPLNPTPHYTITVK